MNYLDVLGNPIAYQTNENFNHLKGGIPIFWCGGFKSDMSGTKAEAFAQSEMPFVRFDYSGHGQSGGDFEKGTISRWLLEAEALYKHCFKEPALIIGSSMGGWIALLLAKRVKAHALLLIAPAPDFTQKLMWEAFPQSIRDEIMTKGQWLRPSIYDPIGTPITKDLIEDGRKNLLLDELLHYDCPIHIVTGARDEDVPLSHVLKLIEVMPSVNISFTLVPEGDHRLSREEDIALLLRLAEGLR